MSWPFPPHCGCTSSDTANGSTSWDAGISWRTLLSEEAVDPVVPLARVRDQFLRVVNGTVEDNEIESMLLAATEDAQEHTQRALMPQTWQMILSGFPTGDIVLERPPLISVTSFDYTDADGNAQSLAVSPL